jgi:hypothetical protein
LNGSNSSPDNSLFNYYRNADNTQIGVSVATNDNSEKLFSTEKDIDYVRMGTVYYKWNGRLSIGGGE